MAGTSSYNVSLALIYEVSKKSCLLFFLFAVAIQMVEMFRYPVHRVLFFFYFVRIKHFLT